MLVSLYHNTVNESILLASRNLLRLNFQLFLIENQNYEIFLNLTSIQNTHLPIIYGIICNNMLKNTDLKAMASALA